MVESTGGMAVGKGGEASERPEPPTTLISASGATPVEPPTKPMDIERAATPADPGGDRPEPADRTEPVWPGLTAAGLPTRVPRQGDEDAIKDAFADSWETGPTSPTPLTRQPFTPTYLSEPPRQRTWGDDLDPTTLLRRDGSTPDPKEPPEPKEPPDPKEPPEPRQPPEPIEPPRPPERPVPSPFPSPTPVPTPPEPVHPSPVPSPVPPGPPAPPVPAPPPPFPPPPGPVPPPPSITSVLPAFPAPSASAPAAPSAPVMPSLSAPAMPSPSAPATPTPSAPTPPAPSVPATPAPSAPAALPPPIVPVPPPAIVPGASRVPPELSTRVSPGTSTGTRRESQAPPKAPTSATPPRPAIGTSTYQGGNYTDLVTEPITGVVATQGGPTEPIEMSGSLTGHLLARNQEMYRRRERRRRLRTFLWVSFGLLLFGVGIAVVVNMLAGDFIRSIFNTFSDWAG